MSAWRTGGPSDEDAVAALMLAFHEESGAHRDRAAARKALAHLIRSPELGRVLVADGGSMVLTVGCSPARPWVASGIHACGRGRDAFIDEPYVRPDARSRGLGRSGIEHAAAVCRPAGVPAIHLEVEDSNPDAARPYDRMGFTVHTRRVMTWPLKA